MKVAVLLFHESHFKQTLPFIKKYPIDEVVIIPLDADSLKNVKETVYQFIIPEYKEKALLRRKLLRRMPSIIKIWGDALVGKVKLKKYLKAKDFDLWRVLKDEIGIMLFDKLYFLELIKMLLARSGSERLILPRVPSTIQLSYLVTVDIETIIRLAKSINIPVLG